VDLSLADVLVAGLGAILGWFVASRSYRLDAATAAADWIRDLRAWANEAIDVLAEAAYHSPRGENGPVSDAVLKQCRWQLSALIDRGRLLLPNERVNQQELQKPRAYRGLLHAAIDPLVAAEKLLGGEANRGRFPDRKAALIGVRREFVSLAQAIVDPLSRNREIARLLKHAGAEREEDPTVGGLLPDPKAVPPGHQRLLALASRRFEITSKPG